MNDPARPVSNDEYIVTKLLGNAGKGGMSQDELARETGWETWTVNRVLCDIPLGKVKTQRVKPRGKKIETRYYLREYMPA